MANQAQIVKGQLWVHFEGRTFVYEESAKTYGKKSSGKASTGDIHAPMPGKVTKILKQVGDQVQVGDVVLVMEAMKMEYTLKADVAGSIQKIDCKVGEQVVLGKILVQLLPAEVKE